MLVVVSERACFPILFGKLGVLLGQFLGPLEDLVDGVYLLLLFVIRLPLFLWFLRRTGLIDSLFQEDVGTFIGVTRVIPA